MPFSNHVQLESKLSKRRQVKNACVHCQKACKKCDEFRPCSRCIKYGLETSCYDSPRKLRSPKDSANDTFSKKNFDSKYYETTAHHTLIPTSQEKLYKKHYLKSHQEASLIRLAHECIDYRVRLLREKYSLRDKNQSYRHKSKISSLSKNILYDLTLLCSEFYLNDYQLNEDSSWYFNINDYMPSRLPTPPDSPSTIAKYYIDPGQQNECITGKGSNRQQKWSFHQHS